MRILLDTHIWLWALTDDRRLTRGAREHIADSRNDLFVSVASVWEIAIKRTLPRSHLPFSAADAVVYLEEAGYRLLPVRGDHAAAVETLPKYHADPFDRLLVAQAKIEPMRLLTHDKLLGRYSQDIMVV